MGAGASTPSEERQIALLSDETRTALGALPEAAQRELAALAKMTEMAGQAAVNASATRAAGPDGENAKIVAAAGEAVAKAEPLKLREDDELWREFLDGAALESAQRADPEHGDSPVRLVDARYIVELSKRGGKIVRRQELPEEAFIGLDTLKRLPWGNGGNCLRVIAVSHPWQQPDHPDPKEVNLTLLAKVLERFLTARKGEGGGEGTTYAVFFE